MTWRGGIRGWSWRSMVIYSVRTIERVRGCKGQCGWALVWAYQSGWCWCAEVRGWGGSENGRISTNGGHESIYSVDYPLWNAWIGWWWCAFSFFLHYAVWLSIAKSFVLQVGPITLSLHSFPGYLFVVDLVTLLSVTRLAYSIMPQFESVTYRIWMGMDPIRVWRCASPQIRPSISVAV